MMIVGTPNGRRRKEVIGVHEIIQWYRMGVNERYKMD